MCPSIHVSLCLEEFSPQTSPSGTNYPMVGVLSMCPPHHFSQIPTSGNPCRPAFLPTWPFMACAPPCTPFHTPPRTSVHLRTPLHTFAHPSAHLCAPLRTSAHLCAPLRNFCASLSRASHPYQTFHFDLGPLRLPRATQP